MRQLALSQQGARAGAAAPAATPFTTDARRAIAQGAAYIAPTPSNMEEAGRVRNFREEMVLQ